jgi:hypothetical protein
MNRNIALGLGTIIGIFAMLLFLQSTVNTGSIGSAFPVQELQLRKLSNEIDEHLPVEFESQKYYNDQPVIRDNPVPDKCL